MSRGEWIALAGVAVALLIAFVPYIWRVWHWNEEKELRRIYRKAAMLGESGFIAKLRRSYRKVRGKSNQGDAMLQSLVAVIENKDFWREAIRPGSVGLVKEKEMFVQKFIELTGNHRREEIEGAVDSLYVEALNRLEIAKSSAWRKRAQGEFTRRNIDNEVSISQRMVGLNEAQEPVVLEGAKPNQLAAKQDKLQELFQWALSHDTERALRVAYELSIFLDLHGQRNEALEALRKALALVSEQGQDAPKELQFQVLNRASHLAIKQAYCDEGEKFAQRMLDLSREVTPDANMATALQRLGKSNYFRCDSQVARGMLEESLDIFQQQEPKDFRAIAWVQFDLGVLEINLDELVSARYWLEKSLTSLALHEGRDKFAEGAFRVNLAFVLHKQGNREAAHSQMAMAEELLGNDSYRRWHLHFLGRLEIAEGNVSAARTHLAESLKICRDRSDELGIIRSLLGFGWLAAKKRQWGRAVNLLGAEEALRKEMNWPEPPDWKTERNFITTSAHGVLGEAAFNATLAEGRAMTWEQAIEYALS